MVRPALLILACAVMSVAIPGNSVQAQGKKAPVVYRPPSLSPRTMGHFGQPIRWQSPWNARRGLNSTIVIRTTPGSARKNHVSQPLVVSTQGTKRLQAPRLPTETLAQTNSVHWKPKRWNYGFKETERFGTPAAPDLTTTLIGKVGFAGGNQTITENLSIKPSSPVFASRPLQVQLNQLENFLLLQPWKHYRPWYHQHRFRPWNPYYLRDPGLNANSQVTINWAGGSENIKTQIVNQYDNAGRFVAAQIQIQDSILRKTARLSPQSQFHLLEAGAGFYPYLPFNPVAFSLATPFYHPWRAFDRFAAREAWPIW